MEVPKPGNERFAAELAVASRLAMAAGAALRRHRDEGLNIRRKADGTVVTVGDLESDALIRAGIRSEFPRDELYTEETADSPERLSAERVWISDPLDATSDYVNRGKDHCVSIGLAVGGAPMLGAIYNPTRDELFLGTVGGTVTLNGSPVRASSASRLADARLEVSPKEWRRGLNARVGHLRVQTVASMSYKLARVAAGLSDGAFSFKRRTEWGSCGGVALVLAAGGIVTLLDGGPLRFNRRPGEDDSPGMVAAGPHLHPLLLDAARAIAGG